MSFFAAVIALPLLVIVQRSELPAAKFPDCLGVNIHFTRSDAKQLGLLADAGFRWVRMDFTWNATEKEKGKYDFADYDVLVDSLGKRRIRLLFILDYSNKLYETADSVRTNEGRKAFAAWAAAAAKRYAGRGVIWEIWNEPNGVFWHPQPGVDDYAKLAVEAARAIRKADSDAYVVAPATSGVDLPFLKRFFELGGLKAIDAVTVHPYRTGPPESAADDYRKLHALIRHYADKEILSGEWGYSDVWGGFSPEKQGEYLARQWLTNLACGVRLSIWYDWRDDGPDPKEPEHHFGAVTHDLKPKPAYVAAKTIAHELAGYEYCTTLATNVPTDHRIVLRNGPRYVLAYWSETDSTAPFRLWVTTPTRRPRRLRNITHLGRSADVTPDKTGWVELKPSTAPQYLFAVRPGPQSRWRVVERYIRTSSGRGAAARVEIWNDFNFPREVLLTLNTTEASSQIKQDVKPGWNEISVPFTLVRRDRELVPLTFTLEMHEPSGKWLPLGMRRTYALIADPMTLEIVPIGDGAALRLEQPYSEAYAATVVTVRRERRYDADTTDLEFRISGHGPSYLKLGASRDSYWFVRVTDAATKKLIGLAEGRFALIDDFEGAAEGWRAAFDGDEKVRGECTLSVAKTPNDGELRLERGLKVDYRFDPGWRFFMLRTPEAKAAISGRPRAVGMWIYGDGKLNQLRCRFRDATGQVFQPSFGPIDWTGWRYVTMDLTGGWHWAGANDGQVHYPIEWDCPILIDSAGTTTKPSSIWIGPIYLVY